MFYKNGFERIKSVPTKCMEGCRCIDVEHCVMSANKDISLFWHNCTISICPSYSYSYLCYFKYDRLMNGFEGGGGLALSRDWKKDFSLLGYNIRMSAGLL